MQSLSRSSRNPEARRLRAAWERRLSAGEFSAVVVGIRRITQFGRPGAAPQAFPMVRAPRSDECRSSILATLAPDERWALAMAEDSVLRGRDVYAVARHNGIAHPLHTFDMSAGSDILILAPAES